MTFSNKYLLYATLGCSLFFSCNNQNSGKNGSETKLVTITEIKGSPEFAEAALDIKDVSAEAVGSDSTKLTFAFDVKNYELKTQTSDKDNKMCNNSDKGQHIHFIIDNQPYKALYEPANQITLANGSEHYLMAFLSRSYHESIKSKGAAVIYHFKISESGELQKMDEPTTPMIFYSRPKGDYLGKDTANVLLDFYVWNTGLSADGYKVKALVYRSGKDTSSFTIDKWESQFLQNLGVGKTKIMLQLVDKDNKKVEGPLTEVAREINLMAGEPLKKI